MTDSNQNENHGSIRFDKQFNIGHLITVATLLVTLVAGWVKLDARQTALESIQVRQQVTIDAIGTNLQQLIRMEERLGYYDRRIDALERRLLISPPK